MPELKRSITLPFLIFYGLGTILGAGIYVLIGKVAGLAGMLTPWSFIFAAIIATFTALSYGELSARLPKSAGEAVYVQTAMGKQWLSQLVGWLIVVTGVVSAATISRGFVGYLHLFIVIPEGLAISLLVLCLGLLAVWGIQESVRVATVITLIEVGGLLYILWIAGGSLGDLPFRIGELAPTFEGLSGVALGAFLAFYAYIGFEDMVNIAEEVKMPQRNLPRGIILVLILSTLLYVSIALVAVMSIPLETLQQSHAPLATIVEEYGGSLTAIGVVSLFAVVNGALVQIIMASRVIYGMANQGLAPQRLAHIHPLTQTPMIATLLVTVVVWILSLGFPLVLLAQITSFVILIVFAIVNASLVILKRKEPHVTGAPSYPLLVPIIGALLCVSLVLLQLFANKEG